MTDIDYIGFLSGEKSDDHDRMFTDILNFSNMQMEFCHNYIQRIFPTTEQSRYSDIRPISMDEVKIGKDNKDVIANLHMAYLRMIRFWHLSGYTVKPYWINNDDHNYKRITRVMKSLELFEMHDDLNDFREKLRAICKKYPDKIGKDTMTYWEI